MTQLNASQMDFIHQYYHLLDTIEEGFNHVDDCYASDRRDLVDPMMVDIFKALEQIHHANESLQMFFDQDEEVLRAVTHFEGITLVLQELEAHFQNGAKQSIICHKLIPSFETWKMNIQHALGRYILH